MSETTTANDLGIRNRRVLRLLLALVLGLIIAAFLVGIRW